MAKKLFINILGTYPENVTVAGEKWTYKYLMCSGNKLLQVLKYVYVDLCRRFAKILWHL